MQCTFRLRKLFWETKVFLFFKFFSENGLISSNQSGYKLGGSYVNELLSVADDIYKSLDCGYDVKGVFLDNLTRFSTMMSCSNWKKGISGNLHMTLQDRLDERKKKSSTERLSLFMGKFTVGVPLLQFLVQCSFSYPLMIYREVSIVGPHPHLFNGEWGLQREGLRFPIKMEGWGKVGEFSLPGEMLDFLLSWEQSWYSYILTITWNWLVES